MMMKVIPATMAALALIGAVQASPVVELDADDLAFAESAVKSAAGLAPKELNQSCGLTAPLPTTPAGETYRVQINDVFFGVQRSAFEMIAWRKPCPADGDMQLMLTLVPPPGGTMLNELFTVRQGSRNFNTQLVRDAAGTRTALTLTQPTTFLLQFVGDAASTFDDDAALTVRYLGLGSGGAVELPAVATSNPPPPTDAPKVNDAIDGAWFNPDQPGQGFLLDADARGSLLAGGWYTAHPTTNQREWYTFLGTTSGSQADVILYRTEGVRFGTRGTVSDVEIGTGRITFTSCTEASFTYTSSELPSQPPIALRKLTTADRDCALATP